MCSAKIAQLPSAYSPSCATLLQRPSYSSSSSSFPPSALSTFVRSSAGPRFCAKETVPTEQMVAQMAGAAQTIGALGDECRSRFIKWFCERVLKPYRVDFAPNKEVRRYLPFLPSPLPT